MSALHNFYVPSGGDEPDPAVNPKFAHKLAFLDEMADWMTAERIGGSSAIIAGDLNIAPLETDVWNHKALLRVVSHTPVEVEKLNLVRAAGPWVDALRHFVPPEEKLYTWWSYRARGIGEKSDRGRAARPCLGQRKPQAAPRWRPRHYASRAGLGVGLPITCRCWSISNFERGSNSKT